MFYEPKLNNHNLHYSPFKSCVVPRPIGWISTISKEGITNLAPYSYFNAVSDAPPMVMFAGCGKEGGGDKDSLTNAEETGEFVVNIVSFELTDIMVQTSTPLKRNQSEIEEFHIETIPSLLVKPPRVSLSPIHLECKYIKTISLPTLSGHSRNKIVFGEVVGVHINDAIIIDGKVDVTIFQPVARLGYDQYANIKGIFSHARPQAKKK